MTTDLAGQNSTIHGITDGYETGNLAFTPDFWNGSANDGEFSISGTHFTPNRASLVSETKYYYAGSQQVAMRQNGELYYLLSDHLGSTTLIVDAGGNKVSEKRYKAWGELRYTWGYPTDRTFTGQRSDTYIKWYQKNGVYPPE